jgi:PPOX class probable F420-dependent enzyme
VLPIPDSHVELVSQPHGCVITTVAPDGLLQSTAMWFLYDEGKIRFSLIGHRKKFRNLQANPACTFFLMNPTDMSNVIEVRGTAVVEPDPDKTFVTKVRANYGADGPPSDGPDDHRYVVTIEPARINTIPR